MKLRVTTAKKEKLVQNPRVYWIAMGHDEDNHTNTQAKGLGQIEQKEVQHKQIHSCPSVSFRT